MACMATIDSLLLDPGRSRIRYWAFVADSGDFHEYVATALNDSKRFGIVAQDTRSLPSGKTLSLVRLREQVHATSVRRVLGEGVAVWKVADIKALVAVICDLPSAIPQTNDGVVRVLGSGSKSITPCTRVFGRRKVRVIGKESELFCLHDVLRAMGFRDPYSVLINLTANYPNILQGCEMRHFCGNERALLAVTMSQLHEIVAPVLAGARMSIEKKRDWAREFGMDTTPSNAFRSYVETETISRIQVATSFMFSVPQFQVGTFRIDLYYPRYKIAVECDEHGHKTRDRDYEEYRESVITESLGCSWVRYNPHTPNFDLLQVLGRIAEKALVDP